MSGGAAAQTTKARGPDPAGGLLVLLGPAHVLEQVIEAEPLPTAVALPDLLLTLAFHRLAPLEVASRAK
eukprot:1603003-Pyramimonas_sp.AAC.1